MALDFSSPFSNGSLTADAGGLGIGLQLAGDIGSMVYGEQAAGYQSQAAQDSGQIAQLESQINTQKQMQMQLNSQRQQMTNLRNLQRARSVGLTTATSQGAQFGSGLSGGYGGESGKAATNTLNTSQNEQIGNTIFGLTGQEDTLKEQIASLQSQAATAQGNSSIFSGIAGIGGGLLSGAMSFGRLFAMGA